MELQKLEGDEEGARDYTLRLIREGYFEINKDIGDYTLHEIKGSGEIAIRPLASDPGVYLRAYPVAIEPDDIRLIMDDVVFTQDVVNFNQRLVLSELGDWSVQVAPGGRNEDPTA